MEQDIVNRSFIRMGKIKEQGNDFAFWQSKPFLFRLATVEQIRQEYNINKRFTLRTKYMSVWKDGIPFSWLT